MAHIINTIGGHPLAGVIAVLVATVTLFLWEYLHLTRRSARSRYPSLIFRIAMGFTILSVLMIVCRFAAVEGL
jgi:hypothetical protein